MRTIAYAVETICQTLTNADPQAAKEIHDTISKMRNLSTATLRKFEQERQNKKSMERVDLAIKDASVQLYPKLEE